MRWEDLEDIAKRNPQLMEYLQQQSKEVLDMSQGSNVIQGGRGHLNPKTHVAAGLRDVINNFDMTSGGKYPVGRTGFLMKAKAGDMSGIGGRKLAETDFRGKMNMGKKKRIRAYNNEFQKVTGALEEGDKYQMEHTGAIGANMGMTQNFGRPNNISLSDTLTGVDKPTLWQSGNVMNDMPKISDSTKNMAGQIIHGATQQLPLQSPTPQMDYIEQMKANQPKYSPRSSPFFAETLTKDPQTENLKTSQPSSGGFFNLLFGGF